MPKIGLQKPKYCPITIGTDESGNETETYGTVKVFAKAVSANTTINTSNVKFYADDGLSEMVNEFTSGSITMNVDDIENEVIADVCGATIDPESKDVTMKDTDSPAYVRFGFIVRRHRNGLDRYRGVIFPKVMFSVPNDQSETKGETIVFNAESITGEIMRNVKHEWKLMSEWKETVEEAETWLSSKLKPAE